MGLREAKDAIEALTTELIKRDPKRYSKLAQGHEDTTTTSAGCGVVIVLFGALFFSVAAWTALRATVGTRRAVGTVVALDQSRQENNLAAPVVEYEVGGQRYRVTGIYGRPSAHKIGEQLPVLYKERLPSEAYVDTFMDRWAFPLAFCGAGGLVMVIGLLVWRSARRCRRVLEAASASVHDRYG
jgi:hypothetical protein